MANAKYNMVKIRLPISETESEPVFVSVNDYSCLIKRGVEVMVPDFVAACIKDSEDAKMAAIQKQNEMSNE